MLSVALISPAVPEAAVPIPKLPICTLSSLSTPSNLRCEPAAFPMFVAPRNVLPIEPSVNVPAVPEPVKYNPVSAAEVSPDIAVKFAFSC